MAHPRAPPTPGALCDTGRAVNTTADAVLLEHTPAGRTPHWDLMIAPPGVTAAMVRAGRVDPDTRTLRTWRIDPDSIDRDPSTQLVRFADAVALPDHRLRYLDFEGAMSGGRGEIRRLAHGRGAWTDEPGGFSRIFVDLRPFSGHYIAAPARTPNGDPNAVLMELIAPDAAPPNAGPPVSR